MAIKDRVQDEIKAAMKSKNTPRLECLRLIKGALLLKEKESASELTDDVAIAAIRSELKKRQQSLELFRELGKLTEAAAVEAEIAVIQEFLPQQLSEQDIESRVRAYLKDHPETNHAGKLTGAMKKELGDLADGKLLNDICKRVLEA